MRVRIYPDAEGEQWLIADDDEKYVEGPFVDIPDEVAVPMREVQDQWWAASNAFTDWVESQIKANGDDYRDYLTGQITEAQWKARRDGCTHPNAYEVGDHFPRVECDDCGRRKYPERWL